MVTAESKVLHMFVKGYFPEWIREPMTAEKLAYLILKSGKAPDSFSGETKTLYQGIILDALNKLNDMSEDVFKSFFVENIEFLPYLSECRSTLSVARTQMALAKDFVESRNSYCISRMFMRKEPHESVVLYFMQEAPELVYEHINPERLKNSDMLTDLLLSGSDQSLIRNWENFNEAQLCHILLNREHGVRIFNAILSNYQHKPDVPISTWDMFVRLTLIAFEQSCDTSDMLNLLRTLKSIIFANNLKDLLNKLIRGYKDYALLNLVLEPSYYGYFVLHEDMDFLRDYIVASINALESGNLGVKAKNVRVTVSSLLTQVSPSLFYELVRSRKLVRNDSTFWFEPITSLLVGDNRYKLSLTLEDIDYIISNSNIIAYRFDDFVKHFSVCSDKSVWEEYVIRFMRVVPNPEDFQTGAMLKLDSKAVTLELIKQGVYLPTETDDPDFASAVEAKIKEIMS